MYRDKVERVLRLGDLEDEDGRQREQQRTLFLKYERNFSEALSCTSRCCTAIPPSPLLSYTILYTAVPYLSCVLSSPIQMCASCARRGLFGSGLYMMRIT